MRALFFLKPFPKDILFAKIGFSLYKFRRA